MENMKTISKKSIVKKVRKEYEEAREWCDYDPFRYAKIMIDTSDGDIWADVFLNENEWKRYHSNTIMALDHIYGSVKDREARYIEDAISKLQAAGWSITD